MENQDIQQKNQSSFRTASSGDESFSLGKLAFLGVLSIALYKFLPLAMLTPVPLIFGILLYGRTKAALLALSCSAALWGLSSLGGESNIQHALASSLGYLLIYFNGVLIAEVILRKVHPVKGLLVTGMIVVGVSALFLGSYIMSSDTALVTQLEDSLVKTFEVAKDNNKEILEAGGEKAIMLQDVFNKPGEIAKSIVEWIPAGIFVGVYLGLYLCMMIVLRNGILWKKDHPYPFTIKELLRFQVPFPLVYLVIAALGLLLGADYLGSEGATATARVVGNNVLYCLGIFYFFQGFGVMLDFLTWLNIVGFFRSMLVVITLWTSWRVVVLVGLFDIWVNFRRFFKKNDNNEGDIQ